MNVPARCPHCKNKLIFTNDGYNFYCYTANCKTFTFFVHYPYLDREVTQINMQLKNYRIHISLNLERCNTQISPKDYLKKTILTIPKPLTHLIYLPKKRTQSMDYKSHNFPLILCPICNTDWTQNTNYISCVHPNRHNIWAAHIKHQQMFDEQILTHNLKIQICYTGLDQYYSQYKPLWWYPTQPGTYIYQINNTKPFFQMDSINYINFNNMDDLLDKIKHFIIFS